MRHLPVVLSTFSSFFFPYLSINLSPITFPFPEHHPGDTVVAGIAVASIVVAGISVSGFAFAGIAVAGLAVAGITVAGIAVACMIVAGIVVVD